MKKLIGIDLGTTNSCVAVVEGGSSQIIPNNVGGRTTPSIVAFTDKNERLVGQIAKRQAITNAANTIYAVKRLIGRKYDSPEVTRARDHLPYQLVPADNGDVRIKIFDRLYSPQEISAMILQYLKKCAEEYLGTSEVDAIITTPAYFDDSQRQATKDAGEIAGLNVKRIINEPTAAALAYGLGKGKNEKIAVYDLGGGTFDISILEISDGVFEVLSTCGDSFLGGEDFDRRVSDWIVQEFLDETGIDLRNDILALQRLKEAAEKAKCELSSVTETSISLPFIAADETGPKHFDRVLTRPQLEEMVNELVEGTLEPCEKALYDAKIAIGDIDKIILVGGQTRMPKIRAMAAQFFGKPPSSDINPDEVVALGAALQGGVLQGDVKDIVLLDVIPLSLGVETHGGLFTKVIDRNSTIPLKKTLAFTTVADNQTTVEVHVCQGERELAEHNRSLARFELIGILPAPRGIPQIDVTFEVDSNGILHVSARDQKSGKAQEIKVTPSSGLSPQEIQRMKQEAQLFYEKDKEVKEKRMSLNRLDGLLKNVQRSFAEYGYLLPPEKTNDVKESIANSLKIMRLVDVPLDDIDQAYLDLERKSMLITAAMMENPTVSSQMGDTQTQMEQLLADAMDEHEDTE
ncbi:MAG: molecular chaperone DnaK [Acidobacteria bacterium]|nr:molecular chaperone DnaK [Acidobacteriota bacterium]